MNIKLQVKQTIKKTLEEQLDNIFVDKAIEIFEEQPVNFRTFVESNDHMAFVPLSERQYMVADFMLGNDVENVFNNKNNLAILNYGKGCIAGSTRLFDLKTGKSFTVKELAENRKSITTWSVDENGVTTINPTGIPFLKGRDELFEVTFDDGSEIVVSKKHKFLTVSGWKPLAELEEDMFVAAPKILPVTKPVFSFPDHYLKFIGYFLGDGSCPKRGSVTFHNAAPEVLDDYINVLSRFRVTVSTCPSNKGSKATCVTYRWSEQHLTDPVRQLLRSFSLENTNFATKFIPEQFLFLDERQICLFLSCLWATGGWVILGETQKEFPEIGYVSGSKKLCETLKLLLLRLGIFSYLRPVHIKGEKRTYYSVTLSRRDDVIAFCKKIVDKKEKCQKVYTNFKFNSFVSPGLCEAVLNSLSSEQNLKIIKDNMLNDHQKRHAPSFVAIKQIAKETNSDHLKFLTNVNFVKIKTVKSLGIQDFYDLSVKNNPTYFAGGVFNHNSGKDTLACLIILYIVYWCLCLKDPQKYFGLPSGEPIDIVNIAVSAQQANQVFFEKFKQRVFRWEWLKKKYHIKVSGIFASQVKDPTNSDTVTVTRDCILFPKLIRAFSGHCMVESMEGRNILCGCLDEAAGFKNTAGVSNADRIYNMLRSSAVSRFSNKWKIFCLSYPRYKNDFIEKMYEMSLGELHIYGDRGATWDIKPSHCFSGEFFDFEGAKIPIEFADEFRLNPTEAKAKYCCIPPDVEQAFIEYPEKINACVDFDRAPIIELVDYVENNEIKKRVVTFNKIPLGVNYIATIDLGLRNDSAALSLFRKENEILIQDLITAWKPDKERGYIVSFLNIEEILLLLKEKLNLTAVWFDQWNSSYLIQKLQKAGVRADEYKLTFQDYKDFKEKIYSKSIRLLNDPDLIKEIKCLQLLKGGRVDHPIDGTKDMCDTVTGAVKVLSGNVSMATHSGFLLEGEFIGENLMGGW
jgi:intein/homing endonuclease